LGAILHECLAGVPAFRGETSLDVLREVLSGQRSSVRAVRPEVPPWLDAVVARALEQEPRKRWAHARELVRALEGPARTPRKAILLGAGVLGAGVLGAAIVLE